MVMKSGPLDGHVHLLGWGFRYAPVKKSFEWMWVNWNFQNWGILSESRPIILSFPDGHHVAFNITALKQIFGNLSDLEGFLQTHGGHGQSVWRLIWEGSRWLGVLFQDPLANWMWYRFIDTQPDIISQVLNWALQTCHHENITYIRNFTGSWQEWAVFCQNPLKVSGEWYLENWPFENWAQWCQKFTSVEIPSFIKGVKFFLDGTLSAQTAAWKPTQLIWTTDELKNRWKWAWQNGYPVAVHAIGPAATHQALNVVSELAQEGYSGLWSVEHGVYVFQQDLEPLIQYGVCGSFQPEFWVTDQNFEGLARDMGAIPAWKWFKSLPEGRFIWGSDAPAGTFGGLTLTNALKHFKIETRHVEAGLNPDIWWIRKNYQS